MLQLETFHVNSPQVQLVPRKLHARYSVLGMRLVCHMTTSNLLCSSSIACFLPFYSPPQQKDSQQRKKGFGKEGRPPKRRRGQPSVGRGYKWSDSSDSDVEGGGGGREREADMRGTRRSRRSNKGETVR